MKIEVIQLKRGIRERLVAVLKGDNRPNPGEPVFELDTGKLYIGDGINNFEDLKPVSSDITVESVTDGQILVYNATAEKWEAKNLADGTSIVYGQNGLQVGNFNQAGNASTPIYIDAQQGVKWQPAITDATLDAKVAEANQYAYNAGQSANSATTAQAAAAQSAQNAETFMNQTMEILGKKFWFGTRTEYENNVVNQNALTEGTLYFIYDYDFDTFPGE